MNREEDISSYFEPHHTAYDATTPAIEFNSLSAERSPQPLLVHSDWTCHQPGDVKRWLLFLILAFKKGILQTFRSLLDALQLTWFLLCQLPRPLIDTIRVLIPLWLTVSEAFLLVALALFLRSISNTLSLTCCLFNNFAAWEIRWTGLPMPLCFRRLASLCAAALSSADQSALYSTTS